MRLKTKSRICADKLQHKPERRRRSSNDSDSNLGMKRQSRFAQKQIQQDPEPPDQQPPGNWCLSGADGKHRSSHHPPQSLHL
ncbi:hypothetical protein A2U01_0004970 [Trifolium medium]|uniref:Uncharacterized protein n=1 Tax=Trifolium medium TaxID=97028 RepID=A0A392MAG3_9FABA|nr:hypothetical protein [Trifolium medium]